MPVASGLAEILQDSWEAGAERDIAPALIDPRGFLSGQNILLTDSDGSCLKRGGSKKKTLGAFGTSGRMVWEGFLHPGRRTVLASEADFGVLASDDTAVLNLGGAGLSEPRRPAKVKDFLFLPGGFIYGGSRKTAAYAAGTVTTTHNSAIVTGAGTLWAANLDAGMIFQAANTERVYVIASVDSNTQITLTEVYEDAGGAGQTYLATMLYQITVADPYVDSDTYCAAGGRLLAQDGQNILRFSVIGFPDNFNVTDYHELPGGAQILGLDTVGADVLIFTSQGVWVLQGIPFDLTDAIGNPQQSLLPATPDIVLWGHAGIARYGNSVVVPSLDSVWIIDGHSTPQQIGKSAQQLYRGYVALGYKPGGAITFKSHYCLPILNALNQWVDTIIWRLDRPIRTRAQIIWPWTQMAGAGAKCSFYAMRSSSEGGAQEAPILFGLSAGEAILLNLSGYFDPAAGNSTDHDGSLIDLALVTRDFPTGQGAPGRGRKARLLYEMFVDGTPDPRIYLDIGVGAVESVSANAKWGQVKWSQFKWGVRTGSIGGFQALPGAFGPDPGVNKAVWMFTKRAPYCRFRIRQSDPVAKLTIRAFEFFFTPPGGNRLSRIS